MNTKPILFTAPMIRALLREIEQPGAGKTQTRRILKPQPWRNPVGQWLWKCKPKMHPVAFWPDINNFGPLPELCPYGRPGDLLYVRESIRIGEDLGADWEPWFVEHGDRFVIYPDDEQYIVPLDYEPPRYAKETFHGDEGSEDYWRSWDSVRSIHMPRWASRLTLHLTDVRVERVQDISEADAIAEGIERTKANYGLFHDYRPKNKKPQLTGGLSPIEALETLWDSIHGDGAWQRNDWVFALTFRPILANVDNVLADPGRYGIEVPA